MLSEPLTMLTSEEKIDELSKIIDHKNQKIKHLAQELEVNYNF